MQPEATPLWKQLLPADLGGRGSVGSQRVRGPAVGSGKALESSQANEASMVADQRSVRTAGGASTQVGHAVERMDQAVNNKVDE